MLSLIAILKVNAFRLLQDELESQNLKYYKDLQVIANSSYFSKIQMSFNDKCPESFKKCSQVTCAVPKIKFQGKEGFIDLLSIKESYSPTSAATGPAVWKNIYDIARVDPKLEKLVSGLHFSVNTHLTRYHTKLFNKFFSHPLLYKSRFKKEYKDNYLFLYKIIQYAVANLYKAEGDIPLSVGDFSKTVRQTIIDDMQRNRKNGNIFVNSGSKKSLLDSTKDMDIENKDAAEIQEIYDTKEFEDTIPYVDPESITKINEMVKQIACLSCEKCKLWGTLQVKGIKAAVKFLNNMYIFKSDVIFLINLFRQLSITMIESRRMEETKYPYLSLLVICHKRILVLMCVPLGLSLIYLKRKKIAKMKLE